MDMQEEDFDRDDDALEAYLKEEGLLLVPIEFMQELMVLMEAHIMEQCELEKEELEEVIIRLEDLIGEDGMMDLSVEAIIGWVNTLKDS